MGSLMGWMVLAAFAVIVLGAMAWALWPRGLTQSNVPGRTRQARPVEQAKPPAIPLHIAATALAANAVNGIGDMADVWRGVRARRKAMSSDDIDDNDDGDESLDNHAWTPDPGPRTPAVVEPDPDDLGPPIPELTDARRDALRRLVEGVGAEVALYAIHGDPEAVKACWKVKKAKWLIIAMGGRKKDRETQLKRIAGITETPPLE
jgi:hypothetical protein